MHPDTKPVVLCFSGADPTGGAGIQADIEAIASHGASAACVITAITAQNTSHIIDYTVTEASMIVAQARGVLDDMPVAAIKIGMLGNIAVAETVHTILKDYPTLPVVYDTVFASNMNDELGENNLPEAVRELILPLCTVITPNTKEALLLAPEADNPQAAAMSLLETGCDYVLLTGTHAKTEKVTHYLYNNHREINHFNYERLQGEYHGSGCTLAASIAALLSHGNEDTRDITNAIHTALDYTYKTLVDAQQLGTGQKHPNRFFWAKK